MSLQGGTPAVQDIGSPLSMSVRSFSESASNALEIPVRSRRSGSNRGSWMDPSLHLLWSAMAKQSS